MNGLWLLGGIIIGLQIGLTLERIRRAVSAVTQTTKQIKPIETARSVNQSGIITSDRQIVEKGKVIEIPEYDPKSGGIVRSRKPGEIRRERDKHFEQVLKDTEKRVRGNG